MLPKISILVCTFQRPLQIRKTLDALRDNLIYNGDLEWWVCDDSSGQDYINDLARDYPHLRLSVTPKNSGWGANVNLAINRLETPIYFFVEDDQVLTRKLDLNSGVALLMLNKSLGMIRYGGLAGHVGMNFTLGEQDIAGLVPTFEQGLMYVPRYQFLEILPTGGGYAAFTYSNRPHLTHKRFHQKHGYYLEGYRLGDTELEYTMRVREILSADPEAPRIAVPIDWITNHWHDIGDSYQHTPYDKGKKLEGV